MIEAAQILGIFSAALLAVAIAAWVKVARGPVLQRLDGRQASTAGKKAELASQLLLVAAGTSALAAILALLGWFAG